MENGNWSNLVSVVIVTYNSENVIEQCLSSLPNDLASIYIVDNASKDRSCEIAKRSFPGVNILNCKKNIGFGNANNLALRKVTTPYALLLNPDTVLEEDTIARLVDSAEHYDDAAIVAPKLLNEDGSLQRSYRESVFSKSRSKVSYDVMPEGTICVEYLSGAVMLLKMQRFEGEPFFDSNIFMFYEDDDICLRVSQKGYSLVLNPHAQVMHLQGKSSPITDKSIVFRNWHMMWSRLYLEKKYNCSRASHFLAIRNFFWYMIKRLGYALCMNRPKQLKSKARALACYDFICGRGANSKCL